MKENEKITIHQTFTENIEALADCELILFCVKSGDTKETAERLKQVIPDSAYVMTLQNGVSNEETLVDIFGKDRVLSAAVYVQAAVESPGVIKQSGRSDLWSGRLAMAVKKQQGVSQLYSMKQKSLRTISEQILLRKWKKYLWNLIFNPLSAATDRTIGQLLDDPNLREIAWEIGSETIEIATLSGYPLTEEDIQVSFQNAEYARHIQRRCYRIFEMEKLQKLRS